jgi:hypothetical protein
MARIFHKAGKKQERKENALRSCLFKRKMGVAI